jgi:hypothetical protein
VADCRLLRLFNLRKHGAGCEWAAIDNQPFKLETLHRSTRTRTLEMYIYCQPTVIGSCLSEEVVECRHTRQTPLCLVCCLGADGYLPKRRPPLLAAYDLGQPDVVTMRREARHIYSPPDDDDYSALPSPHACSVWPWRGQTVKLHFR